MIPKFRAWEHDVKYMNDQVRITYNNFGSNKIFVEVTEGFGWKDVDEKYLMQSTGLHDVNGKEIFEGDVVKGKSDSFRLSCYGEVYWDEEFCRWRINDKKRNRQYEVDWRWKLQIIGNIHEHPELLNQPNE